MGEPSYLYLPDSPFHTDFEQAIGNADGTYRIYVCIYSLPYAFTLDSTVSAIPYLRFIAIKSNNEYTFPSFECNVPSESFDTKYTECINQLFDLNVTSTPIDPESRVFPVEQVILRNNSALVLCKYDTIMSLIKNGKFSMNNPKLLPINDRNPDTTMKWSVVDEIVYEKRMLGVPFDSEVTAFFLDHESLHNILYDDVYIDFPFSVYPMKESDDETYTNILRKDTLPLSKMEKYEGTDTYGSRYGFTYRPIENAPDLSEYIRYVIYAHRPKYLIDVKQSGGSEDTDFGKLLIPTIYFMQKPSTNGTPTQMWGIQSNKQFAEL